VANIKSQKKRILTNAKATDRNKAVKSELRTRIKNANDTASKRVIHPKQAARKKSRLMKKINASD